MVSLLPTLDSPSLAHTLASAVIDAPHATRLAAQELSIRASDAVVSSLSGWNIAGGTLTAGALGTLYYFLDLKYRGPIQRRQQAAVQADRAVVNALSNWPLLQDLQARSDGCDPAEVAPNVTLYPVTYLLNGMDLRVTGTRTDRDDLMQCFLFIFGPRTPSPRTRSLPEWMVNLRAVAPTNEVQVITTDGTPTGDHLAATVRLVNGYYLTLQLGRDDSSSLHVTRRRPTFDNGELVREFPRGLRTSHYDLAALQVHLQRSLDSASRAA